MWSVATWEQYKQTKKEGGVTSMWAKFGPLMLAKCAESLALRRAFPNELSGVYSQEEMAQAIPDAEYTPPKPPAPRANTVKSDGAKASPEAIKLLHTLRGKVGGLVVCDKAKPCPYPNGKRCGYHTQLAAFKTADGFPALTSKDLSPDQISNLITRYEAKIETQAARAADDPDLGAALERPATGEPGALEREPGSDDEEMADPGDLADLEEACFKRWGAGFQKQFPAWLKGAFDYDGVMELRKDEAIEAIRMIREGK
jgi:hypothetical protein